VGLTKVRAPVTVDEPPVASGPPDQASSGREALAAAIRARTSGARPSRLITLAAGWAALVAVVAGTIEGGKLADSVVYILIFAIAAIGYDALVGMAGQLYLGLNGLVAVGAYSSGLLAIHITEEPALGIAVGALAGCAAALISGLVALRLREFYFAIFTLAFGIFVEFVAIAWQDLTGGSTGLGPVPGMLGGNIVRPNYTAWMVFAGSVLGVALVGGMALRASRLGRIWRTIARDEHLAKAFGVNTTFYRFVALGYAGLLAGIAGFMMARYNQFLSPEAFGMALALQLILMVFLGGRGSVWGAVAGSAVVYGINRYFSDRGDYGDIILGGVFIAVLVLLPGGLASSASRLRAAWRWIRTVRATT
jgi:branched-chain amino acid transport system ATP-binding protein/branched-chain amino acid transport system permease protein